MEITSITTLFPLLIETAFGCQTLSDALYHLASRPEFLVPLREEVEWVVAKDGWSKASMQKMRKVDSFLRETQRMCGLGACKSPHCHQQLIPAHGIYPWPSNHVPQGYEGLHFV